MTIIRPAYDRAYVINVGTMTANMVDGLGISSVAQRFDDVVLKNWGQGFFELTRQFAEYAVFCEALLRLIPTEDYPGIYEYEVCYPFGKWYANQLLYNRIPTNAQCRDWLTEETNKFFSKGGTANWLGQAADKFLSKGAEDA